MSSIRYYNRAKARVEEEQVYGEKAVDFLYGSLAGKCLWPLVSQSFFSKLYGYSQDLFLSGKKVPNFVRKFGIDLNLYQGGANTAALTQDESYTSFNQFFIREFRSGVRTFESQAELMPAFCEARYLGYANINDNQDFPVKGKYLTAEGLLGQHKLSGQFKNGPLLIARLCPVDYHRFHFPDDGKVQNNFRLHGPLHSVNPVAFKYRPEILITNERHVTILDTLNFGRLAYIEVGATCVGKIVQTHNLTSDYNRGEEKGYFLFGGSTVILIGEPGKWKPSQDILENSQKKMETLVELGRPVATKI